MGFWAKQQHSVRFTLTIGVVLVLIQLVNSVLAGELFRFGIVPRDYTRLYGILLAPFLHLDWRHLTQNLVALLPLLFLLGQFGSRILYSSLLLMTLIGGGLVWLFGSSGVHAGASGLIFAIWGFLLASAWVQQRWRNLVLAMLVMVLYGGLAFSLLYVEQGVSWSSHFFGLVAGVICANWLLRTSRRGSQN